uniref:Ig-like domain-containing protein n=1 Tax=Catharus ustulatus TaxID=91951 RepID=A0A8C3UA41_CATUS
MLPPSFVKKLENVTSILKGDAVFQCVVAGAQPLSVSWIKDEKILEDDEHHRITFENGVATLKLTNVDLSHRGRYTCQAKNESGVEKCFPAQIIEKAKSLKVTEKDPVTLELSGSPEMKVVWFRNDHEIVASEKFRTSFIDSVAVLEMNHLSTDDSGDYICEAHNPAGKASCSTRVTVKEPPVFSRKPSPVDIVKGSEVSLECEISGTPPFDIAWYKDRRQIRSSKKYKVTAKNYHTSVRILNVEAADVGEYQCKAQNDVGSDTCICTVKLKGKVLLHASSAVLPRALHCSSLLELCEYLL